MKDPRKCWDQDHEIYEDTLVSIHTDQVLVYCVTCKTVIIFYYHDGQMVWALQLPGDTPKKEVSKLLDWGDET